MRFKFTRELRKRRLRRAEQQAPATSSGGSAVLASDKLWHNVEIPPSGTSARSKAKPSKESKLRSFVSLSAWLRLAQPNPASPITSPPPPPTSNLQRKRRSEGKRDLKSRATALSHTQPEPEITKTVAQPTILTGSISTTTAPSLPPESPNARNMAAERTLQQIISQLKSNPNMPYNEASSLLSKAKLSLLQLNALTPTSSTPANLLSLARDVYEHGAFASIRARNPDAFSRYVSQLQPFYELPSSTLKVNVEARNKVTGLYLLLLLTQGRYSEFHSELEGLSTREGQNGSDGIEGDRFLGYPIKLERWLMEGSYDRVWKAMKKGEVPSEEYGVFSEILTSQIRSEIASSSERAYPSLPLSSTKSLLFLDSEGAVVEFARHRGWAIRDGNIYFPTTEAEDEEKDVSQMVIENTLGYARELETIV